MNGGDEFSGRQRLEGDDFDRPARKVAHSAVVEVSEPRRSKEEHTRRGNGFLTFDYYEFVRPWVNVLFLANASRPQEIGYDQIGAVEPFGVLEQQQVSRDLRDIGVLDREFNGHSGSGFESLFAEALQQFQFWSNGQRSSLFLENNVDGKSGRQE